MANQIETSDVHLMCVRFRECRGFISKADIVEKGLICLRPGCNYIFCSAKCLHLHYLGDVEKEHEEYAGAATYDIVRGKLQQLNPTSVIYLAGG
eukprot:jgi/Botrbrau1/19262/Bobra.0073s0012.1